MLCGAGNRILRKCRSERRLRTKSAPQHVRKDSTSSTASSESLDHSNHHRQPRPSTARDDGRRPRMSEDDWDPLRLHPPMDDARSPHIRSRGQDDRQQPTPQPPVVDRGISYHGHGNDADMDDIISSYGLTALRPPPPLASRRPLLPRMKTAEMDIHDGFDFGFIDGSPVSPTSPTERLPPHHHHNHHQPQQHRYQNNLHSATSPVSIAARHRRPSNASTTSDCSSILIPSHGAACLPTAPLPMAPSPNQSRPRPSLGSPDSPSFMLKRGDWKRRGIIFISEEAKVTEDDCFEIP